MVPPLGHVLASRGMGPSEHAQPGPGRARRHSRAVTFGTVAFDGHRTDRAAQRRRARPGAGSLAEGQAVVTEGGRVVEVAPTAAVRAGDAIVDAGGRTVMPG